MPPSSLEERRARLQALLERYCVEAQERLQAIHAAREDYARGDAHALRTLSLHAHTLAGSGATMGFPALSEAASALDTTITPILKNPPPRKPHLPHFSRQSTLLFCRSRRL